MFIYYACPFLRFPPSLFAYHCTLLPLFALLFNPETSFAIAHQPQASQPPHSTMKLLSAFATASLATAALYAREDVVTTIVTTLAEESTTYVVVDGQTEETVVSGTPSVVEVAALL